MNVRGSITVYVCLILSVLLLFAEVCIHSVYQATVRVRIAAGMETGLYNLFAQYDRELLEKYEVFFLDGGCKTDDFRMDVVYDTLKNEVADTLGKTYRVEDGGITGYVLATDENGKAFFEQAVEVSGQHLGTQGVQQLLKLVQEWQVSENQAQSPDLEAEQQYEEGIFQKKEEEKEAQGKQTDNPIEKIKKLREIGVLALVLPDMSKLSAEELAVNTLPSFRNKQKGMGIMRAYSGSSRTEDVLFSEYILSHFPYYGEPKEEGICCCAEYIFAGEKSDAENMKRVIKKLLSMREGLNLLSIYRDGKKSAQLDAYAMELAAAIALPQLQPAVKVVLASCWAFAESIQDVKILLAGGKIPMIKPAAAWQSDCRAMTKVIGMKAQTDKNQNGLSYRDYLLLLLISQNRKEQIGRTLDMVEYKIRQSAPEFHIDYCMESLECEYQVKTLDDESFTVQRSYSYRQ